MSNENKTTAQESPAGLEASALNGLLSVLEAGYDIQIKCTTKRTENKEGVRYWYARFIWEATGPTMADCDWEGFETAKECVEDLIQTLSDR